MAKNTNKIAVTAMTYAELERDGAQWLEANKRFNAYLRRTGWNVDDYADRFAGEPHKRGYDLMMRRTGGEFSAKEWFNIVVS